MTPMNEVPSPWTKGALSLVLRGIAAGVALSALASAATGLSLPGASGELGAAAAQEPVEETHPLEPDGGLDVRTTGHSVRVEVWNRDEVRISGQLRSDAQRLDVSGDANALFVEVVGSPGGGGGAETLDLRVPDGVDLSIRTETGDVDVEGVAGPARLSSTSGGLYLRAAPERAVLNAVSGPVEVRGPVPDLEINSVSGSVLATGVSGRLEANTVSGALEVEAEGSLQWAWLQTVSGRVDLRGDFTSDGRATVESHSGSIHLRVPPDLPADYEVETFSGSIDNGITEDEVRSVGPARQLRFTVGEGTARIQVESFSGSIRLVPVP